MKRQDIDVSRTLTRLESAPANCSGRPETAGSQVEDSWLRVLRIALCRGLLGLVCGLALWALLPMAIGWSSHAIVSGSMEPNISRGDVVSSSPVKAADVKAGRVITYQDPASRGAITTHRVIEIRDDGTFTTRGDANTDNDSTPLPPENVLGQGRLLVPWVGYPMAWARDSETGLLAITIIGLILLSVGATDRNSFRA